MAKVKKLYIDCQILQTPALHRGMGKYTTKLLDSFFYQIAKDKKFQQIIIILNKNLEKISEEVLPIFKPHHIQYLDLPVDISTQTTEKYQASSKLITKFVTDNTQRDQDIHFLITAPFFVGFPSVFPDIPEVKKYTILYDIIPYKIWHLQRIFPDDLFAYHFRLFIEADRIFSISNAVKNDLSVLCGIPRDKITSIDGGPFTTLANSPIKKSQSKLNKPYVLMPSGPIVHKNNERAVTAFCKFNKKQNNNYTLYITSNFSEENQCDLKKLGERIEFTGNISDEELTDAYVEADAVLFPSLAEGLGMPVLESVTCGVPVACSKIPVLMEISNSGFYSFDPTDVGDIELAIYNSVKREDWDEKSKEHNKIIQKYSWSRSAEIMTSGLLKQSPRKSISPITLQISSRSPNQSYPDARLVERIYGSLNSQFRTINNSDTPKSEPEEPSFAAYQGDSISDEYDYKLKITRPKIISSKIIVSIENSKRQHIARRGFKPKQIPYDDALKINIWNYFENGKEVKIDDLVNWIADEINKDYS